MAKKGATQSQSTKSNTRGKDQAMAAHLPPSPVSWRKHPENWPYHNNLGTTHQRPGQKKK